MPLRAFLLLTAICFVWALNVVVSRLVVEGLEVPPLAYAAMRSLLVLLALLRWLRPLPASLPKVLLVTFAVSGGSFALLFVGLQDATPSASAVVNLSGAPLTVLFAIVILGERIGWRRGVGIGLTFAGVGRRDRLAERVVEQLRPAVRLRFGAGRRARLGIPQADRA